MLTFCFLNISDCVTTENDFHVHDHRSSATTGTDKRYISSEHEIQYLWCDQTMFTECLRSSEAAAISYYNVISLSCLTLVSFENDKKPHEDCCTNVAVAYMMYLCNVDFN